MATVVGYFQSGPTHTGPNTKSCEVDENKVDDQVQEYYELGATVVEVDGDVVDLPEAVEVEEVPEEAPEEAPEDELV